MKAVLIFGGLGAELPAAGGNGSFNWAKRTYKTLSVIPVIPKIQVAHLAQDRSNFADP